MKLRSFLLSVCGSILMFAGVVSAQPAAVAVAAKSPPAQASQSAAPAPAFEFTPMAYGSGLLQPPPPPYSCSNDCWRRYVSCQNAGGFLCNHKYTICLRACSGPILPTP